MSLNFKHLRYFWAVAHQGNLTEAAASLHVSQSALSVQIRKLEDWIGQQLFERRGKRLILTEAGRVALDYADTIFETGTELVTTLKDKSPAARRILRVGALTTLSRNFQNQFLQPLFDEADVAVVVRSADQQGLLAGLEAHELDVVLTNNAPQRDAGREWLVQTIAKQAVSLIGNPDRVAPDADVASMLSSQPLIVPTMETSIRISFDVYCEQLGVRPDIRAELDDMALMRVMVKSDVGLAVVPPIVVFDELQSGSLKELAPLSNLTESFHAITLARRFPNPLVSQAIDASRAPASELTG